MGGYRTPACGLDQPQLAGRVQGTPPEGESVQHERLLSTCYRTVRGERPEIGMTKIQILGEINEAEGTQDVCSEKFRVGGRAGCGVEGASTRQQDTVSEHGPA